MLCGYYSAEGTGTVTRVDKGGIGCRSLHCDRVRQLKLQQRLLMSLCPKARHPHFLLRVVRGPDGAHILLVITMAAMVTM